MQFQKTDQIKDTEEINYNIVDMDIFDLVDKFIEMNVPVSELLIEKHLPKALSLPLLYGESLFNECNLEDHLEDVKKIKLLNMQIDCWYYSRNIFRRI